MQWTISQGGITESVIFNIPETIPKNLNMLVFKTMERLAVVGTAIDGLSKSGETTILPNGLVSGHAYSITDMQRPKISIQGRQKVVDLLRIRNPLGK